jgi:hypothetical protein
MTQTVGSFARRLPQRGGWSEGFVLRPVGAQFRMSFSRGSHDQLWAS